MKGYIMGEAEDAVFKRDNDRRKAQEVEWARQAKVLQDEFQSLIPVVVDNLRKNDWDISGWQRLKIDGKDYVGWRLSSHHVGYGDDAPSVYICILADGTFARGDENHAARIEKNTCDTVELAAMQRLAVYPESFNTHEWLYRRGLAKSPYWWD